jgi:hypothetical protein
MTERLVFNANGTYSIEARNNGTNEIITGESGTFTYDGSTVHYYFNRSKQETTETYVLSQDGNVLILNNQADRAWVRIE